jgi:RNA polymerase sigma-70 factor (ECF subfamily)
VGQYGPRIYGWCRRWGLQETDAQDVTQNVLLRLARRLRDFSYDPSRSFRAWLKTLAQRAWIDFLEDRRGGDVGTGDSHVLDLLDSVEARQDFLAQLDEEFDRELFEQALTRVRLRVAPQTWEAFRLTALEGLSGAEAARQIPMRVGQVFVAKGRFLKLLQAELEQLGYTGPPGGAT